MNAKELAEKIVKRMSDCLPFGVHFGYGKLSPQEAIESVLSEALEEAYSKGVTIAAKAYKESVACQLAKEEAYEQSARIADGTGCKFCICDSAIVSQIRQKAREIKK